MTETKTRTHDEESSGTDTEDDEPGLTGHQDCHETVDPATREAVLDRDQHRCQTCGRYGPEAGGLGTLHVHHIDRDPDRMDVHDESNLTVLCRSCHSWLHQQSTPDDSPVDLTEADHSVLLAQDIGILQYLAANGPTRTGDIAAAQTADLTVAAIRERLWVLMGLDNIVDERDRQLVDKDIETGEWGLTDQIENSARGHIPDDPQLLLQRMEDEQVRRALEQGCDRSTIADVLGVSERTTWNKQKRANAYDFPLEAFSRGGRPSSDAQERGSMRSDGTDEEVEEQQRLDTVNDEEVSGTMGRTETWQAVNGEPEEQDEAIGDEQRDADTQRIQDRVQQAVATLQEIDAEL